MNRSGSTIYGSTIAVVGPCASGKSTLVKALKARGYDAHEVAQEHSYAPSMWQQITQPDLLIYLAVSAETAQDRRSTAGDRRWWQKELHRLRHARRHADLHIDTDSLTPEEVRQEVLAFLASHSG